MRRSLLFDDLTEEPDAVPVTFGLDGVEYEIDLTKENKARLDDVLKEFVAAARKAKGNGRVATSQVPQPVVANRADRVAYLAAARAWLASNGMPVKGRGRIPVQLENQYRKQHGLGPL